MTRPTIAPLCIPQSRRISIFTEVFDEDEERSPERTLDSMQARIRLSRKVRFRSDTDTYGEEEAVQSEDDDWEDAEEETNAASIAPIVLEADIPILKSSNSSSLYRVGMLALCLALVLPLVQDTLIFGDNGHAMLGAMGGLIRRVDKADNVALIEDTRLTRRQDSSTDYCKRWSQQSAVVNGTMYIYGGRATTSSGQTDNEWNNDFLTMDLTKSWEISSPSLTSLPQPSGPPPVANGYMWNSHDSLYLYGGEFQDQPSTTPVPFALWEYNIGTSSWYEHNNPQTSDGVNSEAAGEGIQRAAEGAGFGVAVLGRGWYFGGHLDAFTTAGWSWYTQPRVYLKSLLEYTFPGATNLGVSSLNQGQTAGQDGAWRNVTQGGLQDSAAFGERADGVLVYIPGFGAEGVLLGLAGGTNASFVSLFIPALTVKWSLTMVEDANEHHRCL